VFRILVKRLVLVLAPALLAGLLLIAGPALSLRPYRPKPVEFELAPQSPLARASGSHALVSRPLRAGKRFNLVGLRWRGRSEPDIELRVRQDGGRWTRWTHLPAHADGGPDGTSRERTAHGVSAPAWTGQADWVQYRLSRRLPGLRLHFVNTTGTATAGDRARTAVRRAASRGLMAVARLAGVPAAGAQGSQPPIVPRAAWGAADCPPRAAPEYGEVRAAFVHHTVSLNDYTREEAPAAVLAICRFHRNSNGWNDIGYNFVVDKYGTIYEGRAGGVDQAVIGAQAQGYNAQSTGIANLGTYTSVPQTNEALDAMAALIRWKLPLHGQPTSGRVLLTSAGGSSNRYPRGREVEFDRVSGHRDGNNTACPGDALYAQLPDLRSRVGSLAPRKPRTRTSAVVRPGVVRFPGRAHVSGLVRFFKGGGVAGVPVEIQMFTGRPGWRTIGRATTGGDGRFDAEVAPTAFRILRARFPGTGAVVGSVSKQGLVKVRPSLTVKRSVGRAAVGRTPQILGTIAPAKSRVTVVVQRRIGTRNQRVGVFRVRASGGRFRKGFRFSRPGLYRFYAVFPGDRANLAATSAAFYVRAVG
jgi:N-acetylmuramoyl-L-alanine amidase